MLDLEGDNLGAHKADEVRQLIERCDASVLYLPPYPPAVAVHTDRNNGES